MTTSPEPAVSVLVPCFQAEAFLARALESVLAQTFQDWEAVVVDNASTDATWSIASGYAARDPRVRAFRNESNVGPVRNWRRCAGLARGELAGLLFCDDWYEARFLETAVEQLRHDPGAGLFFSAVRRVQAGGGGRRPRSSVEYRFPGAGAVPSDDFLRALLEARGPSAPFSPGCSVMRRGDLVRWLEYRLAAGDPSGYLAHGAGPDVAVYVQACAEYPRLAHSREPLVGFLAHGANLSERPEVRRAYGLALHQLFQLVGDRRALSEPAVHAHCRLRVGMRSGFAGPLGVRGWLELVRIASRRVAARLGVARSRR